MGSYVVSETNTTMSGPGGNSVSNEPLEGQDQVDSEEMAQLERELAEDAQWKRIQKNTFTRWANEHLKLQSQEISNLESDLSDGLRLIKLIEVLSGKVLPRHNKKPNFRSQKLENVSVALQFLEEQSIRIVNIGKFSCFYFKTVALELIRFGRSSSYLCRYWPHDCQFSSQGPTL